MQDESTIPDDLVAMLDLLAQTIVQALGFGVAAINLARPDGAFEVVSVAGDEDARHTLMGLRDSAETWDQTLAGSETWGKLRFVDHKSVVAEHVYSWIPDVAPLDLEDAWHPEDLLFAPLNAEDGSRLGILSVDLPLDGRRPNAATCSALEAFAVSAALAIGHATMRQRAEASEIAFKQQAAHDPLTGIANRSLLEDRLRHAVTARPENAAVMALVFVDLDQFKAINDVHSHAVGDHVLRTVANRITAVVRPHDTVARWGGDEFLILLDQLPTKEPRSTSSSESRRRSPSPRRTSGRTSA